MLALMVGLTVCSVWAEGIVAVSCWRNERVLQRLSVAKDVRVQAVSELTAKDGATIPSAAVGVTFSFEPVPALGVAAEPSAWLTVAVPKDAAPGEYRGKVTFAGADGTSVREVVLTVRYDVLPDGVVPRLPFATNAWLTAYAAALGVPRDVAAQKPATGFSPKAELMREAVEDFAKIDLLVTGGRTMWQIGQLLANLAKGAAEKKTAADWKADLVLIAERIDNVSLMAELNGRKVECSVDEWGAADGYETPIRSVRILQHPTKEWDRPGRPLYVVLHSAGHNATLAINCTRQKGNHDIYRAPDDFFALYPDCSCNGGVDWWWGYNTQPGFGLSRCEKRLLKVIEETVVKYGIDRDRIYLCGNSMGGSGTLGFGLRHGELFAAVKANVPAHVDHACDRLGWEKGVPPGATLADPPILVDYSAQNDKWSLGHERLLKLLRTRKYAHFMYWADYGHANNDAKMLAKNDVIHSFDWLSVKKSDIYPVFTSATTDSTPPWPDRCDSTEAGQVNTFFRWSDASDAADGARITLFLKDLGSRHFQTPASSTSTVSLRRLRALKVKPGDRFAWTFGDRRGTVTVGADGVLTVEGLTIVARPTVLEFSRAADGGTADRK